MSRRARMLALLCALTFTLAVAAIARAEVVQKGTLRVAFVGKLAPTTLPRNGAAPIAVLVAGKVSTTDASPPPQLRGITIAINREGRLDYQGLPTCTTRDIQPASTQNALTVCAGAKVGEGSFSAEVKLPQQSPFPSKGKLIAFNGIEAGRHVILAHVYGTDPLPTSLTIPFAIAKGNGAFGTVLTASLPSVTADVGFITGIQLRLKRTFSAHGKSHSYLSAGCPAPAGFPDVTFPLARVSFQFVGGKALKQTLERSCRASG